MLRFERDYKLIVSSPNISLEIKPPIRIAFEISKSIDGGLNNLNLQIFNLNEVNRQKIIKDPGIDPQNIVNISLEVGYKNSIGTVYSGTIFRAFLNKQGSDIVNSVESQDGLSGINNFISKTVRGKDEAIKKIVDDMTGVNLGKITEQTKTIRPIVLVGTAGKLFQKHVDPDQYMNIESGFLSILRRSDYLQNIVPVVSARTGLINTPSRENMIVTFETQLNPALKLSERCKLESSFAKYLNGVYKIQQIIYKGDNYGQDWKQTITCILAEGFKAI